ncbi:MAG TPA: hypothetical protein VHM91_08825 [Verrucomicrobiales bacterium]|jgi:hypothetical protein|nr:hypothetical protein [Verrucomicrobiales bacterium]
MIRRFFRRVLTPPMVVIAAMIMLFEEWLWDHLTAFMAWVGRAPILRSLEKGIAGLRPYPAMGVFLLPGLMLLPVNIFAVYLTAHGHPVTGTCILIAAKLLGTAILARLFTLCRPSLLTVNWFRRLYKAIGRLKQRLYNSAPWQAAVRWKNSVKAKWQQMTRHWRGGALKRRWRAIGRVMRRKFSRKPRVETPAETTAPPAAAPALPAAPSSSLPEEAPRAGSES